MDGGEDFRSSLVENEGSCEGKITHFVKDLEVSRISFCLLLLSKLEI